MEISAHGSPVVLRRDRRARRSTRGARLAEPGEFTLRAFLNGRIDLLQAEAVADLDRRRHAAAGARGVRSAAGHADAARFATSTRAVRSDRAARSVGRFSRRGLSLRRARRARRGDRRDCRARPTRCSPTARRGRLVREGLQVAIVGEPNVGKSSLFNALVGRRARDRDRRARHDARPGHRDDRSRRPARHAGRHRRPSRRGRRVEAEGVARARQPRDVADLVLVSSTDRRRSTDDRSEHRRSDD